MSEVVATPRNLFAFILFEESEGVFKIEENFRVKPIFTSDFKVVFKDKRDGQYLILNVGIPSQEIANYVNQLIPYFKELKDGDLPIDDETLEALIGMTASSGATSTVEVKDGIAKETGCNK